MTFENICAINSAIHLGKYLLLKIDNDKKIVRPIKIVNGDLKAFCYVENKSISIPVASMTNVQIKDSYCLDRRKTNTIDKRELFKKIIANRYSARIVYTKPSWEGSGIKYNSGYYIDDSREEETNLRTISNVKMSVDILNADHISSYKIDENYITGFCHKRNEQRTFHLDRIDDLEILDLQ